MLEKLPPEKRLIVLLARTRLAPEHREVALHILSRSPCWETIRRDAERFQMGSILCKHLSDPPFCDLVPEPAMGAFQEAYQTILLSNLRTYGQISKILERAQQAGIPVILLKGAFLARFIYGDIALRPMSDIDIFLREKDLAATDDLLLGLGFELHVPALNSVHAKLAPEKYARGATHLASHYHPQKAKIEAHFRL